MPIDQFDIFFHGKIIEGKDASSVRQKVGKIFNAPPERIDKLFSGKKIKIKSSVDIDTACKYRETFLKAGAVIEIKPIPQDEDIVVASEDKKQTTLTTDQAPNFDLAPANTGSMESFAPTLTPIDIPHTMEMSIDFSGEAIDNQPPAKALEVDTSALSVEPANTGSLEIFSVEKEAVELPDISNIHLVK